MNAEFQRIARRDKKAFLSDQCQEIEEDDRIGKTRDLFKKGRNGMDLTEAEDIKKRCQENTEVLHKKDLQDPDNHDGVITHREPDILECEVKWALGSITMNKASGTLCDPTDCRLPGSSIHGIFQARVLEWITISFSRGSSFFFFSRGSS